MAVTINYSPSRIINPIPVQTFGITQTPIQTNIGGTSAPLPNERDRQMEQITNAQQILEAQINTSLVSRFRSAQSSIATVDQTGRVSYVSNGQVRILADGSTATFSILCDVSSTGGVSTKVFVDYLPGWLSYKFAHDLDAKIAGTTRSINGPAFSSWSPITRNPLNWATQSGVDITPIMALNSMSGARDQITLFSPRHAVGCNHNRLSPGTWVQFVAQDGTNRICQRTITATLNITYPLGTFSDGQVYVLDSDVDSYIGYATVLPTHPVYSPHLPSVGITGISAADLTCYLPMFVQDQRKISNIQEWIGDSNVPPNESWSAMTQAPTTGDRAQYALIVVGGDSGSPRCLLYNNRLVVHSFLSGIVMSEMAGQINAAFNTLGNPNGYQLDVVNLNAFPTL